MKILPILVFLLVFISCNGFLPCPRIFKTSVDHCFRRRRSENVVLAAASGDQLNRFDVQVPTVGIGKDQSDVFSRLLQDRILILGSEVNDEVANNLVSQMLYLASEKPTSDITLYINSPGGSVQAGMAIFDTMQFIPCDVATVTFGMAASMGAFLLAGGTKGKRRALPNARIMIHQPLGGSQGEATDLEISAKLLLHTKATLNEYLAAFCDQPLDKIAEDTDRDYYLTPSEAVAYGLIDEVIQHKMMPENIKMPDLQVFPPLTLLDFKK